MQRIFAKIGLRALPSEDEAAVVIDHLLEGYSDLTIGEISLAVDLAMFGKTGADATCYEKITGLYFSNILNAYREWTKKVDPKTTPVRRIAPPIEEPKEIDLSDKTMKDWLCAVIDQIRHETNYPVEFMPPMLYEWLKKKLKFCPTKEAQNDCMARAVAFRRTILFQNLAKDGNAHNERRHKAYVAMVEAGCLEGEEIENVKLLAKKLFFYDFLKTNPIDVDAIP